MENLNGALGFQASLDIDDFNVSAQAMERRIQQVSATAQQESAQMETMFGKAATAFAGIVGIGAAKSFVQQMIQVRSEMQNTEASFKVFLGTADKANEFFSDLQRYAYNNVFEFSDLAKNTSQLLAFRNNVEDVIPIIDKLSNIAAGANAPLAEFVSLYNKAKANNKLLSVDIQMWESRGVPVVYELAEAYGKTEAEIRAMVSAGKIGFKDIDTVITKLTDRGGMFAGMMVEKMKTLGDSIGLLQDNITNMFNELGASNQGILRAGILGVNSLVENYEKVGQVLGSLVIAYGSYKAAMIATNLAQKSETGIAVLDNTVRAIKVTVLKAQAAAQGKTQAATEAMTAAEQQHLATLQASLTAEEQATIQKNLRCAAIASLLTAQQQEYLSNLNLTTSSAGYEAAAMSVLTVEQQQALKKMDLSSKSAVYKAALETEVAAKQKNVAAMRQEVSAACARVEAYKEAAVAANAAVESARYEVYWAKQSGDATRIATAEKKLEAAEENASVARKAALGAQTDFLTKKKALEAATSKKVTTANAGEAASEAADAAAKGANTVATKTLTTAIKALWATIKANPLGWIIGIIGAVVSLLTLFKNRTDDNKEATQEFTDSVKKETDVVKMYKSVLEKAEQGSKSYNDAKQKLNTICKQYNVTLLDEKGKVKDLEKAYDDLTVAIQKSAKAKILSSNIELINREASETEEDALKTLKKQAGKASYVQSTATVQSTAGTYTQTNYANSENIRGASEAIWEMVETEAIEAAKDLENVTEEQCSEIFEQVLQKILGQVQNATGASEKEIEGFSGTLRSYLDTVVTAELDAKKQTDELTKSLDRFTTASEDETPKAVDYATMTFEQLTAAANETKTAIAELNTSDTTGLTELTSKLTEINAAIAGKEAALNTTSSINARIKTLKAEQEQAVIGSEEYKKLGNQIAALQKKLPKSQESANQKAEQLRQKDLAAQRAVEEAKIELIEDSYEKQRATMERQHKRNLDAIQKERTELQKARKAAGKGGLSATEEQGFSDREKAENQRYSREVNNQVDTEIAYKKQQYDLYYKWVQHLGKDVANKQFKGLLDAGSSYSSWIDSELSKLGTKGTDGKFTPNEGLSDSDSKRFLALVQEQQEITGAKSAMDLYQESLGRAMQKAASLAEKLKVVAEYTEKVKGGEFGLNEDETATALVELGDQDTDLQNEVQDSLLSDFKTYNEKLLEIQQTYQALRAEAQKDGDAERIRLVNEGEQNAISELNGQLIMQSDSWKNLFQNLDTLSVASIEKILDDIEGKLGDANLKLDPVDYKALVDSLNSAKEQIAKKNPFRALGDFWDDYKKAAKKMKAAKKEAAQGKDSDAANQASSDMQKAAQGINASISSITSFASDSGNALANMFDSFGMDEAADGIGTAVDLMDSMGTTAGGVAKIMSGDILGGIKDCITGIANMVTIFNQIHDKKIQKQTGELQEQIDGLSDTYERLERAMSKCHFSYTEEERAQMGDLQNDLKGLHDQEVANLRAQQAAMRQQIELEKSKKKTDEDQIKAWEDSIQEIEDTIEDLNEEMAETWAGTSTTSAIDEFGDAIWDAVVQGENAVESLGETIKSTLKNAVKEALKRTYLARGIKDAINYLSGAMEDNVLTDAEKAEFERLANLAGEQYKAAIEALGDWIKDEDSEEDALSGAVRSMSEETGGIVAGRLNAVVINQSMQMELTRQQLTYQAQIAANTAETVSQAKQAVEYLRRMESRESTLLAQGIS